MSTTSLSRLKNVQDAALFMSLVQGNLEILAEEVAKRLATCQNGSPTTIIGPPSGGASHRTRRSVHTQPPIDLHPPTSCPS